MTVFLRMVLGMMLICIISTTACTEGGGANYHFSKGITGHEVLYMEDSFMAEEATMAWVKKNIPESVEKLEHMKAHDPEKYYETVQELTMTTGYLKEIKLFAPRMYKQLLRATALELTSYEIARGINAATDPKNRLEATRKLKQVLTEIFQIRQREGEREISRLLKEIEAMKKRIEYRRRNEAQIIDKRMKSLISPEYHDLEW